MAEKVGAVLVLGAGVGGIRAALDLAESGFRAYLVDRSPGIGGTLAQLDKWFPDNQCELCKLLPVFSRDECSQFCLRRDIAHPNVELMPNTSIEKVAGEAGNFEVSLTTESRWVISDRCTECGLCVEVCPEVFRMNDSGDKAELIDATPVITEKVEEAIAYCAQKCISLE